LTREQLYYVENIRDLAGFCWLPQELARQWFAAHGHPWPTHFEPPQGTSSAWSAIRGGVERTAGTRTNKAAAAEKLCGQWLSRLTERPANKDAAFEAAKTAVAATGPLSRKGFDRAWAVGAPLAWKLPGRRKSLSQ